MAIVLNNITSGYNLSTINSNFQKIEDYVNDKLLARANTGVAGEAMMERDLDMNGHMILNTYTDINNPNSLLTISQADLRYYNVSGDTLEGQMDAASNKIVNLGAPGGNGDATNKSYVDNADLALSNRISSNDAATNAKIDKTLRFPEEVDVMYPVSGRANSLQGYNSSGKPIPVFSMTETADLAIKLASNDEGLGASLVGTTSGDTVQEVIDKLQGDTAGEDKTVLEYFKNGGQFDVVPSPEEIQGVAGISFGGKENRGMLMVDDRGRLKVSAAVNGVPTAVDVHVPHSQAVGMWNGPFKDTQVKFPTQGQADDNSNYGLLFSWDNTNKLPRLSVTSPYGQRQMGAYAYDKLLFGTPIFSNVLELAPINFIGRSLLNSYDTFYPNNDTGFRFHKFATITNPNTLVGSYFTCVLCIGDYGSNLRKTFTVEVNIPSPVTTLTQRTVNEQVRVNCLSEGQLVAPASGNGLPKIGVVQDAANGVVDVYLAIPSRSALFSCTTLNAGRSDLVKFTWDNLRNLTSLAQMSGTSPAGIIFSRMDFPFSTRRTFKKNDGDLVFVPTTKSVLRVHNGSTKGDLAEYPFTRTSGGVCAYSEEDFDAGVLTVAMDTGTNVFTVTGAALDSTPFRFSLPDPQPDSQDSFVIKVITNDIPNKTFSFSLHRRVYTANLTTGAVTVSQSAAITIPTGTWIDVCVAK